MRHETMEPFATFAPQGPGLALQSARPRENQEQAGISKSQWPAIQIS